VGHLSANGEQRDLTSRRFGFDDQGVSTQMDFDPDTGIGVIVLMNTSWTNELKRFFCPSERLVKTLSGESY